MEDRGPTLDAVSIAFLVASWLFVGLRVYIRGWMIKSFGTDDWLMVLTLILFTIYTTFVCIGVSHGTGQHVADLTLEQLSKALKAWWLCEIFYVLNTCALKIAIGAFLLRVTGKKAHNWIVYCMITLSMVYSAYFFFLIIFQCQPTSHFWNRAQSGHCMDPAVMTDSTYAHSAVSAVVDWTFGILPLFIVHDLQMNRRMKISVALLLCFANIGSIATLIRIKYIEQLTDTTDFLFATTNLAIWSSIETGIGILAGSIATYRPLFRSFFSTVTTLRSGTHRTTGPNYPGYKRTRDMNADMRSGFASPTSSTRISGGPSSETKGRGWCRRQERHEMDEDLWKAKRTIEITHSEFV